MVAQNSSAVLQLQMREIRENLNEQAGQVVEKARTQLDWRRYVANHPWTSLTVAALAGYLVVPRSARCVSPDMRNVEKTLERAMNAARPSSQSSVSTIAGGIGSMIAATIAREGVGLLSHFVRQWLEPHKDQAQSTLEGDKS